MPTEERGTVVTANATNTGPKYLTRRVYSICRYGRALTRGLIVFGGREWIAAQGSHGKLTWTPEVPVAEARKEKHINYLRRIGRRRDARDIPG